MSVSPSASRTACAGNVQEAVAAMQRRGTPDDSCIAFSASVTSTLRLLPESEMSVLPFGKRLANAAVVRSSGAVVAGYCQTMSPERPGDIVWQYPATTAPDFLTTAAFASRLPNGNTLISDSGDGRILEVTDALKDMGRSSWVQDRRTAGAASQPFPAHAVPVADGDTHKVNHLQQSGDPGQPYTEAVPSPTGSSRPPATPLASWAPPSDA